MRGIGDGSLQVLLLPLRKACQVQRQRDKNAQSFVRHSRIYSPVSMPKRSSERLIALELKEKTVAKQSATSARNAPPTKPSSAPNDSHYSPEPAANASSAKTLPLQAKRAASSASPHTQKSSKRPRTEEAPASAATASAATASAATAAKSAAPQAPAIKTAKASSPKKVRFPVTSVVKKGGENKSGAAKVKFSFGCV